MSSHPTIDHALAALREHFGYPGFRPGQERAVASVLGGRDTLVVLPTGGGKSLCYQIPALLFPRLTVVVSPLISLMKDQVDALTKRGLQAAFINSTLTANEVADRLARAQSGKLKLLYVAPERFDAGMAAERLRAIGVSLLAVDEAHCISEWGHDFRPSYRRMRKLREQLGAPPTIALTATATPEVRRDIAQQLGLARPVEVVTGFDRRNLHYHVSRTRTEADKDRALVGTLGAREGRAIVYASTRRAVDRIAGVLEGARISALPYHAGLDDARRHEVQNAFMGEQARVIVATNAFGMGIDKQNVRTVVHHAMPGTLEAYYQEAGRAGRDGLHSDCVLLHAFQDRFTHEFFIKGAYPERATVERVYATLRETADATGLVSASAREVATSMRGDTKEREVESAIRILIAAGALKNQSASASRVLVRLLASAERIKRELNEADGVDRDLLRALWRVVGSRLYAGALVDPDGLPPGFGGATGVAAVLDRLQERQFVAWERTGGGVRLHEPRAPITAFEVDWHSIDRRRRADIAKLDAMQRYAYTTGCRRGFVLRYFGDPAARRACDGCDNCLGTHSEGPRPQLSAQRTAGDRKTRSRASVNRPSAPRVGNASAALTHAGPPREELTGSGARLLASLKQLRSSIAREQKVPSYVVFPDRTLAEMAVRRPRSLAALRDVHGVGPAKSEKYGERFVAAITKAIDTDAA
ncbi:MAG: ATP-dependent DNA helicase [Gemmatimonadota bacterium]|nr:ATP-dependent DNA helicase [Gemmatimonadota bacterium]